MSLRLAVQSRDNEAEKLRRLRESIDKRQALAVKPGWVFSRFEDFHAEAREYEVQLRVHHEQSAALQASLERSRALAQRKEVTAPGFMWGRWRLDGLWGGLPYCVGVLFCSRIFTSRRPCALRCLSLRLRHGSWGASPRGGRTWKSSRFRTICSGWTKRRKSGGNASTRRLPRQAFLRCASLMRSTSSTRARAPN